MGYELALSKAWSELEAAAGEKEYSVKFLSSTYRIDLCDKKIFSESCNIPAKDYTSILILHYLTKKLKALPPLRESWVSFKELVGGQGYFPSFKKRVIDVIFRKYDRNPEALFELTERFKAKRTQIADVSIALDAFDNVPLLITFWKGDDELEAEANVLFDKSIADIFCTEDIVILAETVAHTI